MGSFLIVTNNRAIESESLKYLQNQHKASVAKNECEGRDRMDERYFGALIIATDEPLSDSVQKFVDYFQCGRKIQAPVIFISENASKELLCEIIQKYTFADLISYPIDFNEFMIAVIKSKNIVSVTQTKKVIIYKKGVKYEYDVGDIFSVYKSKRWNITIYNGDGEGEEFHYEFPISQFIEDYELEGYIKQSQQSWLVNVSKIKEVVRKKMILILDNGTVVPTSRKFIKGFSRKKER